MSGNLPEPTPHSAELPVRTTPITPDDHPEGCAVHQLVLPGGTDRTIVGRLGRDGQPCPYTWDPCGTTTARTYRHPTTGLTRPGNPSPVGELTWCARCGRARLLLVTATAQERAWGWETTSRV